MKIKKVCILTSVHPPFDGRIFHREAKTLVKTGYNVVLIAQHNKDEIVDGIRIVPLPKPKNRFERMTKVVWRLFRLALKEKADLYHFHDPELISIGLVLKFFGKKVIYDVHEDVPKQILTKRWIPFYLRAIISKAFFLFFERTCFPFFDAVIVAGVDIAKHFPVSPKVSVVRNFPLLEMVKEVSLRRTRKGPTKLIYVGGLTKDRGIKEMIEGFNLIKNNVELVLAGWFFDSKFEAEIKKKIEIDKRIRFVGEVPYEMVFQYLRKADIGLILFPLIPKHIMGISGRINKIFEYMAIGLPIVASDLPGWREMIEDGGYGVVVNQLDSKDVARGIKELIDNPDRRIQMARKGRKDYLNKFNWNVEKKILLRVYQNLLRNKKRK